VGDCWLWSLIIFLDLEILFFSHVWTLVHDEGAGGIPPLLLFLGGPSRGARGDNCLEPPLMRVGGTNPYEFFGKFALKNIVVSLSI